MVFALFLLPFWCGLIDAESIETITKKFHPLSGVSARGEGSITITVDPLAEETTVVARYPQEYADSITIKHRDGEVVLSVASPKKKKKQFFVEFVITTPELKDIDLSGSFSTEVFSFGTARYLDVELSGSSTLRIDNGSIDRLDIEIKGNSSAHLKGLVARKADVDIRGNSSLECTVTERIVGDVRGNSRIENYGKASFDEVDSSGNCELVYRAQ